MRTLLLIITSLLWFLPVPQAYPDFTAIQDITFIDAQTGWLLGTACVRRRYGIDQCPLGLRHSTDGGQTWVSLPIPRIDLNNAQYLRFASSKVGWLCTGNRDAKTS